MSYVNVSSFVSEKCSLMFSFWAETEFLIGKLLLLGVTVLIGCELEKENN